MEGAKYAIKAPPGAPPPGAPPKQKKKKKKSKKKKEGGGDAPPLSTHTSKETKTDDRMSLIVEIDEEGGVAANGAGASLVKGAGVNVEPAATKTKTTTGTNAALQQSPFANMMPLVPDAMRLQSLAQPKASVAVPLPTTDAGAVDTTGGDAEPVVDGDATMPHAKTRLARHSMFVKETAPLALAEPLSEPVRSSNAAPLYAAARGQLNRVQKSRPSMFPARGAAAAAGHALGHDGNATLARASTDATASALQRAKKPQSELDAHVPKVLLGTPPPGAPPQSTATAQQRQELKTPAPLGTPLLGTPPPGAPPQSTRGGAAGPAACDDVVSLRVDSTDAMRDVALPARIRRRLEERFVPDRTRTVDAIVVSVLLCTVTFHTNLAHSLTRSP